MLLLTVAECVCCSWVFIAGRTVIGVVLEPLSSRFPSHRPTHHRSVKSGGNVSINKEHKPRSPWEKIQWLVVVLVSVVLCKCWVNYCTVRAVTLSNSFIKNLSFCYLKKCFQFLNPWDIYLIHPPVFMCTENRRWIWWPSVFSCTAEVTCLLHMFELKKNKYTQHNSVKYGLLLWLFILSKQKVQTEIAEFEANRKKMATYSSASSSWWGERKVKCLFTWNSHHHTLEQQR